MKNKSLLLILSVLLAFSTSIIAQTTNLGSNIKVENEEAAINYDEVIECADIFSLKQNWDYPQDINPVYTLTAPVTVCWIITIPEGAIIYVHDVSGGLQIITSSENTLPTFLSVGDNLSNVTGYLTLSQG